MILHSRDIPHTGMHHTASCSFIVLLMPRFALRRVHQGLTWTNISANVLTHAVCA